MSFFKKKILWIFAVLVVVIVVLAFFLNNRNNYVSDGVNTVMVPVESKIEGVTHPLARFISIFNKAEEYKKQNEDLKAENTRLRLKLKDVTEYIDENERLKRLLEISYSNIECKNVYARVVSHNSDDWFSNITIDKGEKDGIKVKNTVVTAEGLVGQVTEVGHNWAKISTLINPESSAGVRIVRNGEIGIAEGDAKLLKSKKCKLGYLKSVSSVNTGDILETSGLGGIYPPGLLVGKIADLKKDNMGRLDFAEIEPFIDLDNLYEVMIITEWSVKN